MSPVNATAPAGARSCATCPAKINLNDQRISPGRSIGAPICGLKLIPLSRPGGPEAKTFQHFAKGCKDYGKQIVLDTKAKAELKPIEYPIALPDPNAQTSNNWEMEPVTNCTGCANYVPPAVTRKLIGYTGGFCRAKGTLLLEDRLVKYAADCDKRKFAKPADRVDELNNRSSAGINIILFPEYDLHFGKPKPVNLNEIHQLNIRVRPSEYPTDREVTPAHRALGIRAFRRIRDPKGYGPALMLPIMDEFAKGSNGKPIFTDEDRARIPRSGDAERPEKYFDHNGAVYKIVVMWTRLNQTPALWGMPGVGKTELFRHLAWMMNMPFQRISITETSEVDDLFGKVMYTPEKGTYFQYGRIPRAWVLPNILCLDEPNTGQPAVWQRIRPLTDDSKQMVLDEGNLERLDKHRLCYLGMAMNPAWDVRNTGVAPLADADGSRLMHIQMDLPPEPIERQILSEVLQEDGWDEDNIKPAISVIMNMAKEIRALAEAGELPVTWGLRNQKKVLRVKRYASWKESFRMGVTDSLEPELAEMILRIVSSKSDDED